MRSEGTLRVLCIAPVFVPIVNSQAFAGAKLVKALREEGVDVTVLYRDNDLHQPGVLHDSSPLWGDIRDWAVPLTAFPKRHMPRTLYCNLRYLCFGGFPYWVDRAVRRARELHEKSPFDLVFSLSVPMFAHIAGYWCSRRFNLPWVMFLSDPWDIHTWPKDIAVEISPVHALVSGLWQRKAMNKAGLITYPCERLGAYTHHLLGSGRSYEVIPHIGCALPGGERETGFHLVHAGKLGMVEHSYGRSAEGLLEGLSLFLKKCPDARPRTKLTLVGPEDSGIRARASELGLESVLRNVGLVCYEESLKYVASATVCVLVEARMREGIFLPSKFADYVVARKPVLALSPAKGTIADFMPDPGLVRADPDDPVMIAAAVEELYGCYHSGRLDERRPSEGLVQTFDAANVARRFLSALERAGLTKSSRPRKASESAATP